MLPSFDIGPYTLLDRIGQGGMGEVWRARHQTLGRSVAVKLIRPGTLGASPEADREVLARFAREAQTAAALTSPHAIRIHDFGVTREGAFFQVMELLDGLDLEALVRRFGPVPAGRAVSLLRQAADAVGEAHTRGWVHRDIKPSNLYLCRMGTRVDFLKVLDFGLARPVGGDDLHVTRTGTIPGSPATLAPEVLRGDAPSARSDVYALGCVATWLLIGVLPFTARTPLEMVVAHLEKEPAPLTGVPDALAEVVRRCLSKDPQARPTVRELSRALAATGLEGSWSEDDADAWWDAHLPASAPTAEPPPAPLPPPPGAKEEAYTRLRQHFEASRIDLNDYEGRLDQARRAASGVELLDALRGLPGAPAASERLPEPVALVKVPHDPEDVLPAAVPSAGKLVAVFSSLRRGGVWHPKPKTSVVSVFGNAELDLRRAELMPGMTHIHCVSVIGNVEVTVPPGTYVEVHGVGVLGNFEGESGAAKPPPDGTPWVRVTGAAVFGNVEVHVRAARRPTKAQPG